MSDTVVYHENHPNNNSDVSPERREADRNNDNLITKNILLYKNGDLYFPAKRFVVNKKYIRNWESFLEELTRNLNPRNGAIREVRTPFHGTRIKSLDDLTANGKYVAISKGESLKLLDYAKAVNINSPPHPSKNQHIHLKPLKTNNDAEKIESRIAQQLYVKSSIIHVFRNGDPFTRAIKVIIKPQEQKHMNILVKAIEDRVLLKTNKPIRRLYTLTGEMVKYAKDIEDGQYYVAASHEPFENIKYGQYLPVIRGGRVPSKRNPTKFLNKMPTPKIDGRSQRNAAEDSTDQSQKPVDQADNRPKNVTARQQKNVSKRKTEKENAAIKIQAAFRGYRTRNEIAKAIKNNEPLPPNLVVYIPKKQTEKPIRLNKSKREEKPQPEKSKTVETKPQKKLEPKPNKSEVTVKEKNKISDRGKYEPKRENPNKKNAEKPKANNIEEAAIIIQAGFRGYKTRQNLKNRKVIDTSKTPIVPKEKKNETKPINNAKNDNYSKEKAAIIIQAGFRGFKTRQNLKHIKDEDSNKVQKQEKDKKNESKNVISQSQEKKNNGTDEAAIKIQAAFRGFKTRQNMKTRREAATKIQAGFRGFKMRKTLRNKTPSKSIDEKTQEQAAVRIQAGFRGYQTRKHLKENEREIAARKIQAGFRGYQTRKHLKENEREIAAKKIQAGFRGFQVRKKLNAREKAAIKIQAGFRGYQTRKNLIGREKAAEKIQAGYRSFKTRKELSNQKPKYLTPEEQAEERNEAASKIQAAFKGYLYRRENV